MNNETTTTTTTTTGRGSGIKDFLNSSSLIARVSFILLVFLAFVIVLKLCIQLLIWLYERTNNSPFLINGMVSGDQMIIIPQHSSREAITINRSVNAPNGIEFTWSVWIYINNLQYQEGQYRHIFSKGNTDIQTNGLNFPNNAPGLYISPHSNELTIIMNTFDVINEEIKIPDIPINKWINVIIRCQNKRIDVYINGTITKSIMLVGVPKQNYGDVNVAVNGGFSGNISNLKYHDYALGTSAIQSLVSHGPNTKSAGTSAMNITKPDYLSMRWFFGQQY